MPIDCFCKIDGVTSESQHVNHVGDIDVTSWSWDATQPSSIGSGVAGNAKGKAVPGVFQFAHRYDKASPTIAQYCASGKHFSNIVASACQAGDGQKDFLTVTMDDCMIVSVAPSANSGGEVMESVCLAYNKIKWEYKPMDAQGNLGGSVTLTWNVLTTEVS